MKVYTKTGDSGETGLFGGERVSKAHARLKAYGTVDELNAYVGWVRVLGLDQDIDDLLERTQHVLFNIGAELATPERQRLEGRTQIVDEPDVKELEEAIDAWEAELEALTGFILPGGSEGAARAHILRTVVRRAERDVVALMQDVDISAAIVQYLNRLSDCVFVMARLLNKRSGQPDVPWNRST